MAGLGGDDVTDSVDGAGWVGWSREAVTTMFLVESGGAAGENSMVVGIPQFKKDFPEFKTGIERTVVASEVAPGYILPLGTAVVQSPLASVSLSPSNNA